MKSPLEHIEHIRTKPHHVRRRFALLFTALIGGSVFMIWLSFEGDRLTIARPRVDVQQNVARQIDGRSETASPIGAFKSFFETGTANQ